MIKKSYLLSPGPTPLPDSVIQAAAQPIIHHRTPEFSKIYKNVTEGLQYVFQTTQNVFTIASSGSGAMEAAVVNILSPGDSVITINGGKFGDRWSKIARAFGIEVVEIPVDWGGVVAPERLAAALESSPGTKAVFATLSETSTGAVFDIEAYGRLLRPSETLLVVDGISGIGATPCPMDAWGIDVLISASQKSFMTPPGLAYISFSSKAWKRVETSTLPKFYFDASAYKKSLDKHTSPWTPATSLVIQQAKALDLIRSIGLEALFEHHRILAGAVRAGVEALGLELLSSRPGNILTAVRIPAGIDGLRLVPILHDKYKVYIAGAQDPHRGQFFRIAHLGYMGGFDIITALSALEMALAELDYVFEGGKSIRAAQAIFKESWQ